MEYFSAIREKDVEWLEENCRKPKEVNGDMVWAIPDWVKFLRAYVESRPKG